MQIALMEEMRLLVENDTNSAQELRLTYLSGNVRRCFARYG